MKPYEEVVKTLEMLKSAGFEPVDAVFRGAIVVMNKEVMQLIEKLAENDEAMGSITIVYRTPDGQLRSIEIPIGIEGGKEDEKG